MGEKMKKMIEFLKKNIKISALLGGLFAFCSYLISELYLQPLCDSDQQKWYCFSADPTITEQLADLKNSEQVAPWKLTLDHIQTDNQVKIIPKIELADKVYLSLFKINVSSYVIIIKADNYLLDTSSNDKFDLAWNVDLDAGKNFFKVIMTPHAIDWTTMLSNKDVELIESLKKRVNFWTSDSLIIYKK
jgi:hypothetical protein